MRLPSLPSPNASLSFKLPSRSGGEVVGLDIQPGFVAAVKVRVNGSIAAERASTMSLAADIVRDGEVIDEGALRDALRELFAGSGLGKRVRIGVANQRTVLRTLELPPVTDQKELAAAVSFQAQDQVPMPLGNAVLDFQPLGIVDTPQGPRQKVVLVAAQRDMIGRLVTAVRGAGLQPVGVDLSAFALIRSLHRTSENGEDRVLYLNVDGLTNLAIAEGTVCRFTRVVGSGLEGMAAELAVRRSIALDDARALIAQTNLRAPAPAPSEPSLLDTAIEEAEAGSGSIAPNVEELQQEGSFGGAAPHGEIPAESASVEQHAAREAEMSYEELSTLPEPEPAPEQPLSNRDVFEVLENGVREIAGEVRNSLDFHRSQDGGGEVSHVVLSGAAQDVAGFAEALERALGVEVRSEGVGLADEKLAATVSAHRLSVAAGLALAEAPQ